MAGAAASSHARNVSETLAEPGHDAWKDIWFTLTFPFAGESSIR